MQRVIGPRQTPAAYCFLARARTYEPAISGLPAEHVMIIAGNLKHSQGIDICRSLETYKSIYCIFSGKKSPNSDSDDESCHVLSRVPKQFQLKLCTIQT